MPVPARLSLVTLGVDDLPRAVAFYEALGWQRSSASTDEVAFFHMVGSQLGLYPRRLLARDAGLSEPSRSDADAESRPGISLAVNVERAEDVTGCIADAVAAGATLVQEASTAEWGGTVGYFADPDGHLWEVAHNPWFPLDDDGAMRLPA